MEQQIHGRASKEANDEQLSDFSDDYNQPTVSDSCSEAGTSSQCSSLHGNADAGDGVDSGGPGSSEDNSEAEQQDPAVRRHGPGAGPSTQANVGGAVRMGGANDVSQPLPAPLGTDGELAAAAVGSGGDGGSSAASFLQAAQSPTMAKHKVVLNRDSRPATPLSSPGKPIASVSYHGRRYSETLVQPGQLRVCPLGGRRALLQRMPRHGGCLSPRAVVVVGGKFTGLAGLTGSRVGADKVPVVFVDRQSGTRDDRAVLIERRQLHAFSQAELAAPCLTDAQRRVPADAASRDGAPRSPRPSSGPTADQRIVGDDVYPPPGHRARRLDCFML